MAGIQLYRRQHAATVSLFSSDSFPIILGALLGAGIGNKVVFWLERVDLWHLIAKEPFALLQGQSMVGGLLGGLLGVELAKGLTGHKQSTGDRFVFPLLLAICIGRVGCFIAGLSDGTSGNPADVAWAIDYGDGVRRHPAQLYEILFALLLWTALVRLGHRLAVVPGLRFRLMLSAYLLWRLIVDSIKPVPYVWFLGLSGIQVVCLFGLLLYLPGLYRALLRFRQSNWPEES